MSRQLEESKSDLNAQVLEVINSAVAEKVLPSKENTIRPTKTTSNTNCDFRSDGLHQSEFGRATQERDLRSDGTRQGELAQATQKRDLTSVELHLSKISRQNSPGASERLPQFDYNL